MVLGGVERGDERARTVRSITVGGTALWSWARGRDRVKGVEELMGKSEAGSC